MPNFVILGSPNRAHSRCSQRRWRELLNIEADATERYSGRAAMLSPAVIAASVNSMRFTLPAPFAAILAAGNTITSSAGAQRRLWRANPASSATVRDNHQDSSMPLDRLLAERDRSGGRAGEQSRKEIHARDMKIAFQLLPAGFPRWQRPWTTS